MCKHIHLVCQFLKNRNNMVSSEVNKEFGSNNVNKENETSTIISQLNNPNVSNQSTFQIEKDKFKLNFEKIFDGISNLEELNVLKKCFVTAIPTLAALKNDSDKQPLQKLSHFIEICVHTFIVYSFSVLQVSRAN